MKRIVQKFFMLGSFTLVILLAINFMQQRQQTSDKPFVVQTLYGEFQVTEPVLIELFKSPVMERIKYVRQYGVLDYVVKQKKEYTRYEHSVGVWALLRKYGASLEEQIAGLLHDASHTVFSHVGDILFAHNSAHSSYQDDIHKWYLKQQKVDQLLAKHNLSLDAVLHKSGDHRMLEQDLPDICADRFEYNLQAGILTNMLSAQEIKTILNDACYKNGTWFFVNQESAKKLAKVSLFNSPHVWGSPEGNQIYAWTADALKRALEIGLLAANDIHFSTDSIVWDKLWISDDPMIAACMDKIVNYKKLITVMSPEHGQRLVKTKFRGLDPLVMDQGELKRLTELDSTYREEYGRVKMQQSKGWGLALADYQLFDQHDDAKIWCLRAIA